MYRSALSLQVSGPTHTPLPLPSPGPGSQTGRGHPVHGAPGVERGGGGGLLRGLKVSKIEHGGLGVKRNALFKGALKIFLQICISSIKSQPTNHLLIYLF